ncbi:MAG TPA: FecR domain-containing protein [Rhizomicrobium sp.]|nr:FecR domain-containing protein [Rhizomicrobium sp.]
MSDAAEIVSTSARNIDLRAADFVQRRNLWDWSAENQAELDSWLAASLAHRAAFLRLNNVWERAERLSALGRPTLEQVEPAPRKLLSPTLGRIAAVIAAITVLGGAAGYFLLPPRDRNFSTPVGGHEVVTFADGSRIELNTDTVIRTRMTRDQRIVWLDRGEAYFQVKHDALHPFVVMVGNRRVTDIGTKFSIRRDGGQVQVAVTQGRVTFDAPGVDAQVALLTPGDVATLRAGAVSVTRKPAQSLNDNLEWRRGMLVFRHATLADAAAEFNRYNHEKLVIADTQAASLTVVGTFRATNVAAFTDATQAVFDLHVESHGDEIVISR